MGDFQATVEFMVELYKFYNVDLFVRGNYQIRLTLKPPKSNHTIQVELSHGDNRSYTLAPAYVTEDGLTAVSRTFNIYYKDEEVLLKDVFIFRVHLLIDSAKAADCIDKTEFLMTVDVHFTDQKIQGSNYRIIPWATSRTLKFHFSCFNGLHHQIPLLFDYYFFSVLDMIIHANVVSLGLPDWKILKPLKTGWFNKSTVAGRSSAPLFFINIFGNRAQPSYSDVTVRYSAFKTCSITKECFQKASAIHRNLCAILTMAHSQLYNYFEEMMQYVDKKQRITLGEKMDPAELVEGLCEKLEMLESCEEIYDEMCSDFSVLNTQLGFLWLQFRESFKSKDEIRRPMRLQHHRERMMHLSEAFFVQEFPWKSLLNVNDSSFQKHLSMGQCVKSSRYISEIPPVAVECAEVDGDASTTPIFFEDRYVNKIEDDVLEHKSLFNGTRNVEFRSESPLIIDGEGYSGVREAWQDVRSPRRSNELIAKRATKAKLDVVSRLNFRGNIYSDVATKFAVRPYFMNAKPDLSSLPVHFVVCVHGLDGNCGDLRLIRCFLEMALPSTNFEFLMSEANQDTTFMPFEKQTDRLVDEILHYMESYRISPARISFIGHSLGNVIIRSALAHPKMRPYVNLLYTYLSLSGPHLGMVHHTSSIVSTGMWLLQKWKKSDSLLQLSLNDSADMRDTYIYKLSKKKGLEYFTNVLLVSSVQDHYVPFHSSRIELPKSFRGNSLECNVYREMMENLLTPLLNECNRCLVRYSVYHCLPSSTNTFIGRAAHIAMLDSELFIEKLICTSAAKYFQ